MKDILIMLFALVIAVLIVIFTDIAEGETAARHSNFKKLANPLYGDLSGGFHCQNKISLLKL